MAFVQRNVFKSVVSKINQLSRPISTNKSKVVEKSVFISQSNDVYTNLALEEWINQNYDLNNHNIMLYYKNEPCVVIGQDKNPWLDTNVSAPAEHEDHKSIALARRQGTGKTIYHDQGMMNLSFFTPRGETDNSYNLSVIARAMFRKYGLKVDQDKDDLTFYNMKISGNGSTSGNDNSYQNCSLLVDVNKDDLVHALQKQKNGIDMPSMTVKKQFLNISEIDSRVSTDGLLSAIGWEYMRTSASSLKDNGKGFAEKQRGFQMINPTESWFPGITEIRNKLMTWDWCFGKTPKFTILRSFPVPTQFMNSMTDGINDLRIKLSVDDGRIDEVTIFVPPGLSSSGFTGEAKVITGLKGHVFSEEAFNSIESFLGVNDFENEKEKFVNSCVRQVMTNA